MKILCVVASYYPAIKLGGPIVSVHNLCKALAKNNDVTVYTTDYSIEGKVEQNKQIVLDGVKVTYFKQLNFLNFFGSTGWQFSPALTNALKSNLSSFDIIYLVGIWNYPTAVAAYFCRKFKKPYLISPRGSLYPVTIGKKLWKKRIYLDLISRNDLVHAAAIHYTTYDEYSQCHRYLNLKNEYIIFPNGLNTNEFDKLPPRNELADKFPILKDKKVILFLGRINWVKGLDLLIKSFAIICKQRKDVHLLFCGESDPSSYIFNVKKMVADYNLDNNVTFMGMLTGADKLRVLSGSDIFVLCSFSENFGMAVIEAMACGLPVIVSDQVGIRKEVEASVAGLVVKRGEAEIASAIAKLLSNDEIRKQMGLNAKKLVADKFDINKIGNQMSDAFYSIIRGAMNG